MLLLKTGVEPSLLSATHSNEVKMACIETINPRFHLIGSYWLVLAVLFSARRFQNTPVGVETHVLSYQVHFI